MLSKSQSGPHLLLFPINRKQSAIPELSEAAHRLIEVFILSCPLVFIIISILNVICVF